MTYLFKDSNFARKACFYIPFIVAPLSCLSSSYVVYRILRKQNRPKLKRSARDQLLFGMSLLDIMASFGLSFSTLPGPEESINTEKWYDYPRFGNVQTCEAQAFFVHMGVGVPWYNAAICLYYVLSIRYNVPDHKVVKWLVPISHCIIVIWTLATAFAGLALEVFNYAGILGCWIGDAAKLCEMNEEFCDRGANSDTFQKLIVLIPIALALFIVMFSMSLVYCTVRRIEANSARWDATRRISRSSELRTTSPAAVPRSDDQLGLEQNESRASPPQRRSMTLTRRTMRSCLLYSGAFLLVYVPIGISSFVPRDANELLRWTIRVLSTFFFPLQGFLNMLIFTSSEWVPWLTTKWTWLRMCCCKEVPGSSNRAFAMTAFGNVVPWESSNNTPRSAALGDSTLPSIVNSADDREVSISHISRVERQGREPTRSDGVYLSKSLPAPDMERVMDENEPTPARSITDLVGVVPNFALDPRQGPFKSEVSDYSTSDSEEST